MIVGTCLVLLAMSNLYLLSVVRRQQNAINSIEKTCGHLIVQDISYLQVFKLILGGMDRMRDSDQPEKKL